MTTMTNDAWDEFYRRTIPTPPEVYRRRRLAVVIIVAVIVLLGVGIAEGVITNEAPPTNSPDLLDDTQISTPLVISRSSDGRYHTCGVITEDGVTEHLDEYAARCGDQTDTDTTTEGR